jgi:predicted nucleic acid-binding protein
LFIGREQGRALRADVPDELAVSAITVAELRLGVLMATTVDARSRRMDTLHMVELLEPIPVDDEVASSWARLVASLRAAGRRAPINDSWIAATALAHGLPVATQDADYDGMPDLTVIHL